MQTVDRKGFMLWAEGVCLDFKNGKGFAAPESDCIAAQEALDKGEKIALTVNGKIVSHVVPKNGEFYEVRDTEE